MDNQNIAAVLQQVAADRGEKTALVQKKRGRYRHFTFADLDRGRRDFSARLRAAGIGRGDRVMLMVRPSMEFITLTFALFSIGAVVILIDPGMGYRNLLRCIRSVKPDILIGIPRAVLFSRLFPGPFATVRKRICVGRCFGIPGESPAALKPATKEQDFAAAVDDPAAIIFTTGSTGPPKGVQYTHGIFHAQLNLIKEYYGIGPGEVDQPAFPLFALFSTALGACAVIPDMDPSRPAKVNPQRFIRSLMDEKVTYSFGSPAIWNVVSRYCLDRRITLPVKKILMAGAPVSGELVERVAKIMPPDGEIHTPYGATESLPIASITGREIVKDCRSLTAEGHGVCVGRPLPGITLTIIRPVEGPIADWQQVQKLDSGEIGEIVVKGPVVTRAYDHNPAETQLAKITDGDSFRHRMGDMGYFDTSGRLWFCGRKAHVVHTADGPMYTICCEGIFNTHPHVLRSALVGIGRPGARIPVILVEKKKGVDEAKLLAELQRLAGEHAMTEKISTFFVHNGFPVDIRHNAKIFREKLSLWAEKQISGRGCDDGL
ncbi:MAG TPA: peptide synthase [Desulfobulbaceae bacterium]|nr:peptide synthase [Desulfobulbaceae bacterium]